MNSIIIDTILEYVMPLTTILLGIIFGWIFKRFVHQRLKKITQKTDWKGDDVFFEAIESHIVLWFFLISLNIASTSTVVYLNSLRRRREQIMTRLCFEKSRRVPKVPETRK